MTRWDYSWDARLVQYLKTNQYNPHINRLNNKNHMVISTIIEKAVQQNSTFTIKTVRKLGITGKLPQL